MIAGLHERARGWKYGDGGGGVGEVERHQTGLQDNLQFVMNYVYFQLIMYIFV